jgi:predicted O-methyltransferase YrrM
MSPGHGRRIYDHIRATRPREALELGSAHGVGAAYMAAALAANGAGRLTTVDYNLADYDPSPEQTLGRLGLLDRVTIEREHSTYNWSLKERIEAQTADGVCEPLYDFVYLDGSKNWNVDGLAVFLVEKLLREDGWLVMDDLGWVYGESPWAIPDPDPRAFGALSPAERDTPHLRAVFELLVAQHPSFTELRVEDEWFGWARKRPGAAKRLEITTSRSLPAMLTAELRKVVRRRRRARGG